MALSTIEATKTLLSSEPPPIVALDGDPFTPAQWETLIAIMDAVVPSIAIGTKPSRRALMVSTEEYGKTLQAVKDTADANASLKMIEEYMAEPASANPSFKPLLRRMVCDYVRKDQRDTISLLLTTLGTRPGSLLLTRSATPFAQQPINFRHQTIQNWLGSYIPPLKAGAKSLTTLARSVWVKTSPTFPKVLGFPRVPVHGNTGDGYDFKFIQIPPGDPKIPEELETDVVIIGSGCGAGVAAKNIAEAGHRVLVAEKAYHFPPKHLPMTETDGSIHLFDNGGADFSDDSSTLIMSGSAWGGGGTVNWSASLQTQEFVRREWADKCNLPFFTSSDFQQSLDRVFERMGASADNIEHNNTNRTLLEGARKLGYTAKPVPQNTGGTKHYCGYCTFGCGSCEKQGPAVSFLPDAHRAGAQFIEGLHVERVLFEKDKKSGKQVAVGVKGTWIGRDSNGGVAGPFAERTRRQVIIRAKRVIVSGGSLQSPLLLLRSGLKNPHIGRHLHLHPVTILSAIYDQQVNPWEGGILTAVVTSLENLDAAGHGPKLEALTMMPSILLPALAWNSGTEFKAMAANYNRMAAFISLVRERDTGRVYPDPHDGKVRVAYTPTAHTAALALDGLIALAKIAYVAGARRLVTVTRGVPVFEREDVAAGLPDPGINDPRFQAWLALVRKAGLTQPDTTWGSAHQMGSNRMSARAADGVVDPACRVWGTRGLYVMDASNFPSASGVNPMVTNMAITDHYSRQLALELTAEGKGVKARL